MGTLAAVDLISLRGGGCALNTSSALGRLGLHTAVVGKVGADPFGDFLLGLLEQRRVDAAGVRRDPTLPTSASVVCVDTAGESTFLHLTGANAGLRADEIGDGVFHCRALHLAGALVLDALDGEPAAALLAEAQLRGIHTSLDTAFDPSGRWERVLPSLPHCHLVTPDLNEAQAVTGEEEPARAARRMRELGATEVAVTLGRDGCYLASERFDGHVPGFTVQTLDGTAPATPSRPACSTRASQGGRSSGPLDLRTPRALSLQRRSERSRVSATSPPLSTSRRRTPDAVKNRPGDSGLRSSSHAATSISCSSYGTGTGRKHGLQALLTFGQCAVLLG